MKKCNKCGEDDQGAFYASRKTICKPCKEAQNLAWRLANPVSEALDKKCNKCGEDDQRAFSPAQKTTCKPCANAASKAWSLANPESQMARSKKWKQENPGKVNANSAKRRATQLAQTPEEANITLIQALYTRAAWLRETFGVDIHVDHRIPLSKGGEHTIENLQLLPAYLNLSKGAKLWLIK